MSGIASQPTSARACIWCGGKQLTAEHVWPRWIAKYLPAEKASHHVLVETEGREPTVQSRGERVPFTTTVKCVCKDCNTGWMHELETAAEPILAPLIEGKHQAWHEWRQAVAATWALKTSILIEQAQPDLRAIPTDLYSGFRANLRPPPYTQIWMAGYEGDSPHFYGRGSMRLLLATPEGVDVPNDLTAYGACLQVGALVFRLFGHNIRNGPRNVPIGNVARCLIPIWPVSSLVEWPPSLIVDNDGLELLVKSMGDTAPPEGVSPGPQSLR